MGCDETADGSCDPQWERAHQAWELFVSDAGASESVRRSLRRVLRVKRSEREAFFARLPGVVRRGARVDLEPLERALRGAGVACELRRRSGEPDARSAREP